MNIAGVFILFFLSSFSSKKPFKSGTFTSKRSKSKTCEYRYFIASFEENVEITS